MGTAVVVGIAVAIPAGTFVYINFIRDDPPAPLTLDSDNEGIPTTPAPAAGGDTVVQRGIKHAWVNRGTERCRLINTSVAAPLPA